MGVWILVEEEQRHSVLKKGIPQQLEALVGNVLLTRFGSQSFQYIHYIGLPAHTHRHALQLACLSSLGGCVDMSELPTHELLRAACICATDIHMHRRQHFAHVSKVHAMLKMQCPCLVSDLQWRLSNPLRMQGTHRTRQLQLRNPVATHPHRCLLKHA